MTKMRRLLAIAGIAAMTALIGAGALAGTAGAQTTTPTVSPVFTCSFALSTTTLPTGGGQVLVSGFAPADTLVHIFVNGVEIAQSPVRSSKTDGSWGPVTVTITATSDLRVSVEPAYTGTPCVGPGGTDVQRVVVAGASAQLAFTGSNHTTTYVLVGATLLATGLALAVAARRRERTHGRV